MALSDAVMSVVEEMEAEAKDLKGQGPGQDYTAMTLRGYAKALRAAVKAAEGAPANPQTIPGAAPAGFPAVLTPFISSMAAVQHDKFIEQERARIRREKAEENLAKVGAGPDGQSTVYLVGGPLDGTSVVCPADVEVGLKTNMGTAESPVWYRMGADHKAHYVEGGTPPESKILLG